MVSVTLPLLVTTCEYVTEPPGNVCCVFGGAIVTAFTAFTVTEAISGPATRALVAEAAVNVMALVPGAALPETVEGTVTTAQIALLPAGDTVMTPVWVTAAPSVVQLPPPSL